MKKLVLFTIAFLASANIFAQNIFDKFDGQNDVTTVIVNKKMFSMMGSIKVEGDKNAQQYMNLIKKLDNLKVFSTANPKIAADMKATADKYLKSSALEELMRVNENGKNVKIWIKSGSNQNQVKELLLFVEGKSKDMESVLLSLTGDFDMSQLSILTDKLKLPVGEDLKKVTKSKK